MSASRCLIVAPDDAGSAPLELQVESEGCYTGNALAMTDDDAVVIAGSTSCSGAGMRAGGDDFVAFKVDMDGREIWRWQASIAEETSYSGNGRATSGVEFADANTLYPTRGAPRTRAVCTMMTSLSTDATSTISGDGS